GWDSSALRALRTFDRSTALCTRYSATELLLQVGPAEDERGGDSGRDDHQGTPDKHAEKPASAVENSVHRPASPCGSNGPCFARYRSYTGSGCGTTFALGLGCASVRWNHSRNRALVATWA